MKRMYKHDERREKGFTVVELVVVCIVIGILAMIIITTYNGVQLRARNAARINAARQVSQVVRLASPYTSKAAFHAAMNVSSDGWYSACLGTNYKDANGDGKGDCGIYNGSPYVSESAALNPLLAKNASDIPSMVSYPVLAVDGDVESGPYLGSATVDSKDMLVVEYTLESENQDCVLSPLMYYTATGAGTMTPTATPKYSVSANGVTECAVIVYQ